MGLLEELTKEIREIKLNQERLESLIRESILIKEPEEDPDTLYNTKEAAEFLGLSPGTLSNDRVTGLKGIPFEKKGRSVRYRLGDLKAYRERCLRYSTCDLGRG